MMAIGADTLGDTGFTSSVGLDPSLTFAAFITGEANVLAFNAAQRMGATEKPQFSPLYLKAATGQGKTHLLHAIGHSFLQAHPRSRIFYCSAERFMVEFVQALKQNQMIEFKARLRSFDLLLVDDILDTGKTISKVVDILSELNPASLRSCMLLEKQVTRSVKYHADFVGFTIPDKFVVGYGLDFAGRYRNIPVIGVLKPELQSVGAV